MNKYLLTVSIAIAALIVLLFLLPRGVFAHDPDNAELNFWYESLMQPDAPKMSCCGVADAYWADEVHVRDGKTYAVITDDRPDEPRNRPHRDIGSEFEIPNNKLKWDKSNPTGHGIIFLSRGDYVYCYVQPGGV